MEWDKIKAEYVAGGTSYRKLAEKHGITLAVLRNVAEREEWVKLKAQAQHKTNTKLVESISKTKAKKAVDKLARVSDLTDKLLDKLEQAIAELDTQLCKDVVRVKEIEYKNTERPDKPTKETIHEEEKIIEYKTIVDRSGLKAIASSLRDIKEIQMLKSEADQREQEARIKNLEKQAEADENASTEVTVRFETEGEKNEWAR